MSNTATLEPATTAEFDRAELAEAVAEVSAVVPTKSPKPILENLLLEVDSDGAATIAATNLEVAIRYRIPGIQASGPIRWLLPARRLGPILRSARDKSVAIEVQGQALKIRGEHWKFDLATEDPATFPDVPVFPEGAGYHAIPAADLRRAIRRTVFACDPESTRYALGGALIELREAEWSLVATDGRRMARQVGPATIESGGTFGAGSPVVPSRSLKLIERILDDGDSPAHLVITSTGGVPFRLFMRGERATIFTRLVEGRFPRYQDIFPAAAVATADLSAGDLLDATEQAMITTSDESRGVEFAFGDGKLVLAATAADVGSARVDVPIVYAGEPFTTTLDARYLVDALRTLDPGQPVRVELVDEKSAIVLRIEDGYTYVLMPLSKDR